MRRVRFVVPEGIDDPVRVSGGNIYDRQVRDGLRRRGWTVDVCEASGPDGVEDALREAEGVVLVDGLVASWNADAVQRAARRGCVVVLAHMVAAAFPDADAETVEAERRGIRAAHRVIATSRWTADELVARGLVEHSAVTVAAPGARPVDGASPGADPGDARRLLSIGVLAPHKGQDVLLQALAGLVDLDWTCTLAGSADTSPRFAAEVIRRANELGPRVQIAGVLDARALDAAYRACGALVAPSRVESSGMAIQDARARGIPVIASSVGGIPDTVAGGGAILVPPGDPDALAGALRAWLGSGELRARLRAEARRAAPQVPHWDATTDAVERALEAA